MEEQTFRSRLLELLQRSRKAMRLYASMGKSHARQPNEFSEMQAAAWQETNAELVRRLSALLDAPHSKRLVNDAIMLRDQIWGEFRVLEKDLHGKQLNLIAASEHGDFAAACSLSKVLVGLKAKLQATQAAHHEFEMVLRRSKLSGDTIELGGEKVVDDKHADPIKFQIDNVRSSGTPVSSSMASKSKAMPGGNPISSGAKVIPLRKVGQ